MTDPELRLACLDRAIRVGMTGDVVLTLAERFHDFVRAGSPAQPERGPDGKFRKAHVSPEQAAAAADEAQALFGDEIDVSVSKGDVRALTRLDYQGFDAVGKVNEAPDVLEPKSKLFRWFGGD